jgi:triosephosphate isomerase
MRRKVIAGNWKMNNDLGASINLASELKSNLPELGENQVIVCPPFTSLESVKEIIKDSKIELGAQNMSEQDSGAFTGEISASMLKSVGCEYVILGHSERRTIYKESDELINAKIKKAIEAGLKPIFCIGETLAERESEITNDVVKKQLTEGLKGISEQDLSTIIVAYEPVWAIGTGKTATPEQAQEVHKFLRGIVSDLYSSNAADNIIIQYGGSVKPDNANELLNQPDIDGALVGGACLKSESFIGIINY